jgi:PAS domain S-box-containing protein
MGAAIDSDAQLQRRLAAIFESTHDAVWSLDRDGTITSWNPAAEQIFGYPASEALGARADFMLPPDRPGERLELIERAGRGELIQDFETQRVRADGAVIDVSVTVSALIDPVEGVVGASLIARDITSRKRAADAQAFLAEASALLETSLDPDRTLGTIAQLAIPRLGELCIIDLPLPDGRLGQPVVAATDPQLAERLVEIRRQWPLDPAGTHPVSQVLRSSRALLVPDLDKGNALDGIAQSDVHRDFMQSSGYRSAVVLPLIARRRTLGIVSLLHVRNDHRYDASDVALLEDLAARAALAYDNARLYAERSRVARTLQRSLLPAALAAPPGLELAVRYRPATTDLEVGGDFYDVFETDPGWMAILGDVCGKGPQAAALTALTRYTAKAAALTSADPLIVLAQINEAMLRQGVDHRFATALLAHLDAGSEERAGAGSVTNVTLATAGHPVALILRADGTVTSAGGPGNPLGIVPDPCFHLQRIELRQGDTLVAYTDGLVDIGPPDHVLETDELTGLLRQCAGLAPAFSRATTSRCWRCGSARRLSRYPCGAGERRIKRWCSGSPGTVGDLIWGGGIAQPDAEALHDEVGGGTGGVAVGCLRNKRLQVAGEVGVFELSLEVLCELWVGEDLIGHVVLETGDNPFVVSVERCEHVPEVEEVTSFAALVERAELGGHKLVDRERADLAGSFEPRARHFVGDLLARKERLDLLDVGLDLDANGAAVLGRCPTNVGRHAVLELARALLESDRARDVAQSVDDVADRAVGGAYIVEILAVAQSGW